MGQIRAARVPGPDGASEVVVFLVEGTKVTPCAYLPMTMIPGLIGDLRIALLGEQVVQAEAQLQAS